MIINLDSVSVFQLFAQVCHFITTGFMDDSDSSISQTRGAQRLSRHSVPGTRPVERPTRPKRHQSQPSRQAPRHPPRYSVYLIPYPYMSSTGCIIIRYCHSVIGSISMTDLAPGME